MEERCNKATGTKGLNQSRQRSMAMGGTSMALNNIKNDQGAYSHLMFANYHLCYVLLGISGLFAYLEGNLRISSDQHCSHSLVPTMP